MNASELLPPAEARPVSDRAEVLANEEVGPLTFEMVLRSPRIAERAQPGQFVMVTAARDGGLTPVLPRPMALYDWDPDAGAVSFVYRVVGEGTHLLSMRQPGAQVELLGPLGQGFTVSPTIRGALLIGRGLGVCSLAALAVRLAGRQVATHVLVSARRHELLLGLPFFEHLGLEVTAVTDQEGTSLLPVVGSLLEQVLDVQPLSQLFVAGSRRLLDLAVDLAASIGAEVQVFQTAPMGCGLGYCGSCALDGPGAVQARRLVCRDGPVFRLRPSADPRMVGR
ncbi:MAG: dihydroorotate oxidase electron transfer subunit [Chloroflexi bacterium]|nr:dihydroorotate oxidase electron transfer subunit [Chloroflexota bacterium]